MDKVKSYKVIRYTWECPLCGCYNEEFDAYKGLKVECQDCCKESIIEEIKDIT